MEDVEDIKLKYVARKIADLNPGGWSKIKVGVFEQTLGDADPKGERPVVSEVQVGEYDRNYGLMSTFVPFMKDGKWYALYSTSYMYTRIMSLPDCKDLGGEDKDNVEYKDHFCPVEFLVPIICVQDFKPGEVDPRPLLPNHDFAKWCKNGKYPDSKDSIHTEEEKKEYAELYKKQHALYDEWNKRHPFVTKYADFGFVAGCVWGDDSSWKIEFLDLREADKGIVKRDARFGYLELPRNCDLKQAIDTEFIDEYVPGNWSDISISIARPFRINLDGTYSSWWVEEQFNKLKKKYVKAGILTNDQADKVQEIFSFFFTRGLDDGVVSDSVPNKIDELIQTLVFKQIKVKYVEVSFIKKLFMLPFKLIQSIRK